MKAKYVLVLFFLVFYTGVSAQDNSPDCYGNELGRRVHFSAGLKYMGVGFGSFRKYNGMNLNFANHTCRLNGICLTGFTTKVPAFNSRVNGLNMGLGTENAIVNGLNTALLFSGTTSKINGLNFGFLGAVVEEINGANISFFSGRVGVANGICMSAAQQSDTINGFSMGLFVNTAEKSEGIAVSGIINFAMVSNGLSVAPVNAVSEGKGLQVGVFNMASEFKGVQLGLLNKIDENRRFFRIIPFINFRFKRKPVENPVLTH